MKKLVVMLSIVFVVGLIFLSCTSTDNLSVSYKKYQKLEWADKIKVLNKIEITSNDITEVIKKTGASPSPDEEGYKTYYKPVSDKDLIKTEVMLHSTNTFWQYIESKGYNKTNVRILKGEEVLSMPWPKNKEEAKKVVSYYHKSEHMNYPPGFVYVDKYKNIYVEDYGFGNNLHLQLKKYNKNRKFIKSILYTTNSGPHYDESYFVLHNIYIDSNEQMYLFGRLSDLHDEKQDYASSRVKDGVKEYNKDGKLVKKGILKDGYYINSKGEKISDLELRGRGYRKKYELTRSSIISKSKWWLEIKIFNYRINKQNFHSYIINRSGQFETFFIDKYGTTYCIYKKRKINDLYFGHVSPNPNTFGYILIVSPVEKGGRLLGVVPIMNNGHDFSKKQLSWIKPLYITSDGFIYDLYSNDAGVHIVRYSVYNNK